MMGGEARNNLSELSWLDIETVRKAHVVVAGAGALGNEVLKNLALFGVGNIFIVDFDTVEKDNLSRSILFRESDARNGVPKVEAAAKMLKEINPSLNVRYVCGRLASDVGLGVYRKADVAIGCLDSKLARLQLNRICMRAGIPWVDGGIEDMVGNVKVFKPGVNCYECSLSEKDTREISMRLSCSDIARRNVASGHVPTTPIIASIIGAVQVQEALKIIHKDKTFNNLVGKIFHYDGLAMKAAVYEMKSYFDDCPSHEKWENIVHADNLSAYDKLEDVFVVLHELLKSNTMEINLVNDKFVDKIVDRDSGKVFRPMLPDSRIPDYIDSVEELRLRPRGSLYQNYFENIDIFFPYQGMTLREIGIPLYDVIQVSSEKGQFYVELGADKDF